MFVIQIKKKKKILSLCKFLIYNSDFMLLILDVYYEKSFLMKAYSCPFTSYRVFLNMPPTLFFK